MVKVDENHTHTENIFRQEFQGLTLRHSYPIFSQNQTSSEAEEQKSVDFQPDLTIQVYPSYSFRGQRTGK